MANTDMRRRLAMMLGDCPVTIKGVPPITTARRRLLSLKAFGGTEQNGTPAPDTPVDIVSNNGVLKLSRNLFSGVVEQGGLVDASGDDIPSNIRIRSTFVSVKPNTTYNISWVTNSEMAIVLRKIHFYDANNTWMSSINRTTFTTPADTAFIRVGWQHTDPTVTITPSDISNVQLELGSVTTPYTPYSPTGVYADDIVETIQVTGKNLFDKAQTPYADGAFIYPSPTIGQIGYTTSLNNNYNIYRIKVLPNTTYTFGAVKANQPCWVITDSSNKVLQAAYNNGGTDGIDITVTTEASAAYLYLSVGVNGTYKCDDILQLERGSSATVYEPYYDGGTATAEKLLKVGDYQDVQEILSGSVTRNVGVKVLDGVTEGLKFTNVGSVSTFYFSNLNAPGVKSGDQIICSHFINRNAVQYGVCYVYVTGNVISFIHNFQDLTTANAWLTDQYAAGTPVIVVYPLATPATETVAGQTLALTNGTNVIDITQASLDNLELEVKVK